MLAKFRKNQFGENATSMQLVFDLIFGIVMPLLCFYLDPIVFQTNSNFGEPLRADIKAFAYSFSFGSIVVFAVWLCFGNRLKAFNAVIAGLFFTGSAFCFVIGLLLFPYSLLGLLLLIGTLGFTPFFTGIVYLRNGFRAYRLAKESLSFRHFVNAVVLSAVLSFVFPAILNLKTNQAVTELIYSDPQTIEVAADRLKYLSFFINSNQIARAYSDARNPERQQALSAAYRKLFGREIVKRVD